MLVMGARTFGKNIYGRQYIPQHALGGIEARFLRSGTTWFSFDLLTGGGGGVLHFAEVGDVPVRISTTSFGATLGASTNG